MHETSILDYAHDIAILAVAGSILVISVTAFLLKSQKKEKAPMKRPNRIPYDPDNFS